MAQHESERDGAQPETVTTGTPALADLVKRLDGIRKTVAGSDARKRSEWDEIIVEFLTRIGEKGSYDRDLVSVLDEQIAAINARLGRLLDSVLHHQKFQRLEASWRGVADLVRKTDRDAHIKIRVLPVKRSELDKDLLGPDLQGARKMEESALYKKVYRTGLGTLHGNPIGLMMGDFEFGPGRTDVQVMDRLGQLAQQSLAPFVAAASPAMLDVERFAELGNQDDLKTRFESAQFAEWRGLRDKEHSKFLALCAPRVLVRGAHDVSSGGFTFKENVSNPDGSGFLWGSGAYGFAECVHRSFAQYGWCLAMRGVQGGGLLEDLPVQHYQTDLGDTVQWPVEFAADMRQDMSLSELGFMSIVHLQNQNKAVFLSAPSVHQRVSYMKDKDNAREFLSSELPYTLVLSRFGHHIKHMLIDRIGTTMGRTDIENFLHEWIHQYVEDTDNVHLSIRAKKPLRKASVTVVEVPGRPGAYRAEITLVPHFLLDEVSVHLSLGADTEDKQA